MNTTLQIYLFGGLRIPIGEESITRFRTQKTAALLAYLALFRSRSHPREELIELFWPDDEMEAGRTSLRGALSALRRTLEPAGTPAGSVIVAEGYHSIHLNAELVTTDVAEFEAALARADRAADSGERARQLARAVEAHGGPLLPGYYDLWAVTEANRLAAAYLRALGQLSDHWERAGDTEQALHYARNAVSTDPLSEEAHADVIRLLRTSGQQAAALRQYRQLEELLRDKLGIEPSPEIRALLEAPLTAESRPSPPATAFHFAAPTVPGAPPPPPVPEPAEAPSLQLPATLTRFFGREDEIAALERLLRSRETRLVTVTGPGGSGKTRLSLELIRKTADAFPGGVWFVPLADITDPSRLMEAVADTMGLPRAAGSPLERIVQERNEGGARRSLLVLDNVEQIAEAAAEQVASLLSRTAAVCCLVTSRQRLLLSGEQEFPLPPLPTPTLPGTPERLMEFSSIRLFVDRARIARNDFSLTPGNTEAVAALAMRLEGLPLAIELAAAWSQTLSPAQLLQRMDHRFDLLISRRRDIPERHRSLRAAIETSYDLLPDDLKRFFIRLSVFHGGWTLEAAEFLSDEPMALTYLAELQDRSLIVAEDAGDTIRHRMLETLREFAAEQLGEAPDVVERYRAFFLQLTRDAAEQIDGPEQVEWLARLESEHENLRAVLDQAAHAGDSATTELTLVTALWRFWMVRGHLSEGRRRIAAALERADADTPVSLRAAALYGAASLAGVQGDIAAAEDHLTLCRELFQNLGDPLGAANSLCSLANVEKNRGDYTRATAMLGEALSLFRSAKYIRGMSRSLQILATIHADQSLFAEAGRCYQESLTLSETSGDLKTAALILHNMGVLASRQDDVLAARRWFERSLEIRRTLNDIVGQAHTLEGLGTLAKHEKDLETADRFYEESLALHRRAQDPVGAVLIHLNRAVMAFEKSADAVWPHLSQAITLLRQRGNRRYVAYALEIRARVAQRQDDFERAARLCGAALALRTAINTPLGAQEENEFASLQDTIRAAIGDEAFNRLLAAGKTLQPEEALEYAAEPPPAPKARNHLHLSHDALKTHG